MLQELTWEAGGEGGRRRTWQGWGERAGEGGAGGEPRPPPPQRSESTGKGLFDPLLAPEGERTLSSRLQTGRVLGMLVLSQMKQPIFLEHWQMCFRELDTECRAMATKITRASGLFLTRPEPLKHWQFPRRNRKQNLHPRRRPEGGGGKQRTLCFLLVFSSWWFWE